MAALPRKNRGARLPRLQGGATTEGPEYEHKMAALVALRARAAGLQFRLYSNARPNARAARPFDDLVLRVLAPQPALYLVQLKHSRGDRVTVKDLVSESRRNKHFLVAKYFEFFEDPLGFFSKNNGGAPTEEEEEEEELLREVRAPHTRLLLCTTKEVQRGCGPRPDPQRTPAQLLRHGDLFRTSPGDAFRFETLDSEVWNLKNGTNKQDDYQDFLSRFLIFDKQNHSNDIDSIVLKEVKRAMGFPFPRAEAVAEKYIQEVKAWAQEDASGGCLSEDLPQLGAAVAAVLRDVALAVACSETLRFDAGRCARLRAALCADGRLRVLVPRAQPGLRAAKALQLCEEQHFGRWTYADEAVLRQYPLEAVAAAASACRVLVLDADGCPEGARELLEQLGGSVQLLQLCSDRGEDWDALLGPTALQLNDDWRLHDLTVEAQETLLDCRVKFQGASVHLRDLEGAWPRLRADVDGALLGALARGDAALGAAPPAPDDAPLHLPRALQHFASLDAAVLELEDPGEHLALQGVHGDLLDQLRRRGGENDRWSVLPAEGVQEAFDALCARHSPQSVHWVRAEGAALEWRATRGREAALAPFVRPWSAQCVRRPLCVHEGPAWGVAGRPLLLVGDAGEGKTCALRRAAAEARERAPARWAVFVGLLGHSQLLRSLPQPHEIGWEHALELLAAAAAGVAAASEAAARRCLEAALRGGGGVSVYVDGVDEVSPLYQDKALRLLSLLLAGNIHLCVSSRPEPMDPFAARAVGLCAGGSLQRRFRAQAELRCAAARLRPLCAEEQQRFLCARWGRGAATAQVAQLAELSVEGAARSLLAAPLYLHMAAEAFAALAADDPQRLLDLLQRSALLLLELYARFMEQKQAIYNDKHGFKNMGNHNLSHNFNHLHQNCAMYLLTSAMGDESGPFKNYLRSNSDVAKEKRGIAWVDENAHPHFSHFSFAEYFGARWLHENKSSDTARRVLEYLHRERADGLVLRFLAAMLVEGVDLPLHEALLAGDQRGVARALEDGACVDAVDGGGRTALHVAVWRGAWRVVKVLLWKGCDPTRRDSLLQWTPLQYLRVFSEPDRNALEATEALLRRGADASELWKLSYGNTEGFLSRSSFWNCLQVTLWATRQSQECRCSTVLEGAAFGNSVDVARAVLGAITKKRNRRNVLRRALGAIWRRRGSAGQDDGACVCGALSQGRRETSRSWLQDHHDIIENALHTALEYGSEEVAVILMEHIPLKGVDEEILHNALKGGCLEIAERLLREGAAVTTRDSKGNEPLHCLLSLSNINRRSDTERRHVLLLLLARGADANSEGKGSDRPLHLAALGGLTDCIECLINAGADYTLTNSRGQTPVHSAASGGRVSALRCLIRAGADPRARDSAGTLPVHLAGSAEVVHFLLEGREGDCGATDDRGRTPLHSAAEWSKGTAVAALLHHGADLNAVDREGQTPLHRAMKEEIVQLLLEHGADVGARDKEGRLPLHCTWGAGVVRLLLGARADPEQRRADANARDHGGRTPLHLAARGAE